MATATSKLNGKGKVSKNGASKNGAAVIGFQDQEKEIINHFPSLIKMIEQLEWIRTGAERRQTHLGKHLICQVCTDGGLSDREALWVPNKTVKVCPRCSTGPEMSESAEASDPFIERYVPEISDLEQSLRKAAIEYIREHPVWRKWAKDVRGLGEISLAKVMGHINIELCNSVTSMWSHSGHGLRADDLSIQRKVKGEKITYDPKLQAQVFVVAECLMRAKSEYYQFYINQKRRFLQILKIDTNKGLPPEKRRVQSEAHAHNRAFRHMRKLFLSHLWEVWRNELQLGTRMPYVFDYLEEDHKKYIRPFDMVYESGSDRIEQYQFDN